MTCSRSQAAGGQSWTQIPGDPGPLSPAVPTTVSCVPVLFLCIHAKPLVSEFFPVFYNISALPSPEPVASPFHGHAGCSRYASSTPASAGEDVEEAQPLLGLLEEARFHNK